MKIYGEHLFVIVLTLLMMNFTMTKLKCTKLNFLLIKLGENEHHFRL